MGSRSQHPSRGGARLRKRGFTLIEMMIVVAVVGILSALAVYGVRKYLLSAKTSEALEMIREIKSAQESYKSDTFSYLDVSGNKSALSDLTGFYPTATPGKKKWAWGGGDGTVPDRWRSLNVVTNAPVQFAYGCSAGGPDDGRPDSAITAYSYTYLPNIPGWEAGKKGQPWYVVKAVGDLDGDGVDAVVYLSASFTGEVFNSSETDAKPPGQ
jgi:type IV pilus assembly protein PilA